MLNFWTTSKIWFKAPRGNAERVIKASFSQEKSILKYHFKCAIKQPYKPFTATSKTEEQGSQPVSFHKDK